MENTKYTAIYTESWMAGSHRQTLTLMRRVEQQPNETVEDMLLREDIIDNLVFLFEGHPKREGEDE